MHQGEGAFGASKPAETTEINTRETTDEPNAEDGNHRRSSFGLRHGWLTSRTSFFEHSDLPPEYSAQPKSAAVNGTTSSHQNSRRAQSESHHRSSSLINAVKSAARRASHPVGLGHSDKDTSSNRIGITGLDAIDEEAWPLQTAARVMASSHDDRLAAFGNSHPPKHQVIEIYNLASRTLVHQMELPPYLKTTCLAFSPDGTKLASGHGGLLYQKANRDIQAPLEIKIWNVKEGKLLSRIRYASHQDNLSFEYMVFTENDKLFCSYTTDRQHSTTQTPSTYFYGSATMDTEKGTCIEENEVGCPFSIKSSPDRNWAATMIDNREVTIYEGFAAGCLVGPKKLTLETPCKDFACSSNRTIAFLYGDGSIIVQSVLNDTIVGQANLMQGFQPERMATAGFYLSGGDLRYGKRCMAYSSDGKLLVALQIIRGQGAGVCLLAPQESIMSAPITTGDVAGMWFSQDGQELFCLFHGKETAVRQWNVAEVLAANPPPPPPPLQPAARP